MKWMDGWMDRFEELVTVFVLTCGNFIKDEKNDI